MLTERQLSILRLVATHYTLTAAQFRRLLFRPEQARDGRLTRRLLATLVGMRLLNKARCEVVNPLHGLTCPVYYPSRAGCEALAVATGEPRFFQTPTQTPQWQNLRHWTCLSDLRILLDAAVRAQQLVEMPAFFNEFDAVKPEADNPADRFRLYTIVSHSPRRVVCVPDAAFAFRVQGASRAFYVELEMGTNPPNKTAAEKAPGYAGLAAQALYKRHFADAGDFRVLCFAPDAGWRDVLRRAYARKDGAQLWKFAALSELRAETMLHAPLFYPAGDGIPAPLVKGGVA